LEIIQKFLLITVPYCISVFSVWIPRSYIHLLKREKYVMSLPPSVLGFIGYNMYLGFVVMNFFQHNSKA